MWNHILGYGWSIFLLSCFFFLGWLTHSFVAHNRVNKLIEDWNMEDDTLFKLDFLIHLGRIL